MQRRPLSEEIRWIAAASYIFPIGLALLLTPRFREIRLVRYHSLQGTCLFGLVVLATGMLSVLTAGLGTWLGLGFMMLGGLFLISLLVFYWIVLAVSAFAAYGGKTNKLALVTPLVNRLEPRIKRLTRTI